MSTAAHPSYQLREACRASAARWAAWLVHTQDGWEVNTQHALSQTRQKALRRFTHEPRNAAWLAGALSSSRMRWHSTGSQSQQLGVGRIYAFPNAHSMELLLVGAEALEKPAEGLFRILASMGAQPQNALQTTPAAPPIPRSSLSPDSIPPSSPAPAPPWSFSSGLEASYDPQGALQNVLEFLSTQVPCHCTYLAVRSGEVFRVQAAWHCPATILGYDIPVQEDAPLQELLANRRGVLRDDLQTEPRFALRLLLSPANHAWMGLPIQVGQRLIGFVAFGAAQKGAFDALQLQLTAQQVEHLAYNIESALIFSEVARYLQQLALLNELASTASLGVDKDEFARRVMLRLRRTFKTDWAAVLLLSADGTTLLEFGGGFRAGPGWAIPVRTSLMGLAVQTGLPLRVGDVRTDPRHFILHPDIRSELAAPLKYRGRVIGALVLVSNETNAFSQQDEQLLVVIASHMAGLFENARLNEETRERAIKLADSVRQLQAVRDTSLDLAGDLDLDTLLTRVVQRARSLVGARGAELGLYNEEQQVVDILVSDTPWENFIGLQIPLMAGVAGRLAAFGEPIVVTDYNAWSGRLLPHRHAAFKAVAGVPLKFKGQVIGTLTVLDDRPEKQFQSEDVQLLELLAPQAAISIRNARLYQELQERIKAQHLAESRLLRSARLAAVGEMAAGVAHELNNPLTTVTGFVELAIEDLPPDSPQRADLELVLEESYRARGVVRRLLDFSRPVEDQRVRADVNELVGQVIPLVQHLARTGGVAIQTELASDLPWISLDPNQIKQVLLNLIHNGLQAMHTGGLLTIRTLLAPPSASEAGDEDLLVAISIRDTGEGIPPENLERLFEPFFTTRPAGRGTGLGLSVSYGIVSSHGGHIEVESQVSKGSNFTIYLPQTGASVNGENNGD